MFVVMLGLACILVTESNATISGQVVDENQQPVEGAIVVVSTARPRTGLAIRCPSCYSDCTKRTLTDATGRFSFDGLSNDLTFRLAAGGFGHRGTISDYLDPAEDSQMQLVIRRLRADAAGERVKGQVVDAEGEPIVGALVRSYHIHLTSGAVTLRHDSVAPLTLTDVDGNFDVDVGEQVSRVAFRVTSPRTAPSQFDCWRSSERRKAELNQGASIRGRLLFDGQPLVAAMVGIVQSDHWWRSVHTPMEISTDDDGFFQFDQLPVDRDYSIYTQLNQNSPGVLPVSYVLAPGSGQQADLGEIDTEPAHTLEITVRTVDGQPILSGSKVYVGRRGVGHRVWLPLVGEGSIATVLMSGFGKEQFEISIRIVGYKIQRTIPKLPKELRWRNLLIDGDTELTIVIEQR